MKAFRYLAISAVILGSLCVKAVSVHAGKHYFVAPMQADAVYTSNGAEITQKNFVFDNGGFFWLRRYNFLENSKIPFQSTFAVPGNILEVRYVENYVESSLPEKRWAHTSDLGEMPKTTLFVSTDKYHLIIGVPAVYEKQEGYDTMKARRELEPSVKITRNGEYFNVGVSFPQNTEYIAELWALQSPNALIEWNDSAYERFMSHDLSENVRLSFEGYYYQTPSSYTPGGKNVFFKHPSNYTGGSFSRLAENDAQTALGYVLMKLSLNNQNETGYYPTPCESSWLKADFNIGAYYYDTRWNADFLSNLVSAHKAYGSTETGDSEFLERALKYAEFYLDYASNNNYPAGDDGILVMDYRNDRDIEAQSKTHVSLNHHLAGLNAMLELYDVTKDEDCRQLAESMLLGVENTYLDWILQNGNLAYALHYNGTANTMLDYPYLTYNDLIITRRLISNVLGKTSEPLQTLIDSKLAWMTENGITGYRK